MDPGIEYSGFLCPRGPCSCVVPGQRDDLKPFVFHSEASGSKSRFPCLSIEFFPSLYLETQKHHGIALLINAGCLRAEKRPGSLQVLILGSPGEVWLGISSCWSLGFSSFVPGTLDAQNVRGAGGMALWFWSVSCSCGRLELDSSTRFRWLTDPYN